MNMCISHPNVYLKVLGIISSPFKQPRRPTVAVYHIFANSANGLQEGAEYLLVVLMFFIKPCAGKQISTFPPKY